MASTHGIVRKRLDNEDERWWLIDSDKVVPSSRASCSLGSQVPITWPQPGVTGLSVWPRYPGNNQTHFKELIKDISRMMNISDYLGGMFFAHSASYVHSICSRLSVFVLNVHYTSWMNILNIYKINWFNFGKIWRESYYLFVNVEDALRQMPRQCSFLSLKVYICLKILSMTPNSESRKILYFQARRRRFDNID